MTTMATVVKKCGTCRRTTGHTPSCKVGQRLVDGGVTISQQLFKRDADERALATPTSLEKVQMVRENSVCLVIDVSRFSVRRSVGKDEVSVETKLKGDVDQTTVAVAKDLLDSPELREIVTHDHYTKLQVKAWSVPSELMRAGAYLLSLDALKETDDYLVMRLAERGELVKKFRTAYPALVKTAKTRLGPLWKAEEYPAVATLEEAFKFVWRFVEIGTPDAKLKTISQALFKREADKADKLWSNSVGQIEEALAQGMADVIGHLAEQLTGGEDGKPKRFREASVKRAQEFLAFFDKKNLTKNADLTALVDQARSLINGGAADVTKSLKTDKDARAQVVAGFADIKKNLAKMLEDRPARAISFSEEPV